MQQLQAAVQAYQGKDLDGAEAIFKQILALNPKEPNALHLLGCIYKDRGQLQQAVELIQASIREDGCNPIPFLNLGKILAIAGQHENAAGVFQESLKRSQQIPETWFCFANALREIEKIEEAKQAYRNALQLNPAHAGAASNLGALLTDNDELEEAEQLFSAALEHAPANVNLRINYGKLFAEKDEHTAAIVQYQIAVPLAPDLPELHYNLANSFKKEGKVEEAIASYRKAIEVKPDFADAYLGLGIVLKEKKEFEESKKSLLEAVKMDATLRTGFCQLFDLFLGAASGNEVLLLNNLSSAILRSIASREIICFGDSHVGVFDGIPGFEKVWVGAATAYNLIKSQSSTKGREKIFRRLESAAPGSSAVLLSFGEVDCRSNILKYCVRSGKSIDEVCADAVSRYFEFVGEIIVRGFSVVLCGPYGSGSDHNNQGNTQERYYASVCMEKMLRNGAKERGIPYFSLHGVLTDAALRETRLEFFDDGLHFPGHKADEISSDVKSVVLSRMLEAVNESHALSVNSALPVVVETSLVGEDCLCLLDVFSDQKPVFYRLGMLPDANARVASLSQASKSIVIDLGACLNVEVLKASFSASSVEGVEVWGLDNNGDKEDAVINIDARSEEELSGVRLNAVFPQRSMLRYLVVTCPEGLLSTLSDFDVRGQSFVFHDQLLP